MLKYDLQIMFLAILLAEDLLASQEALCSMESFKTFHWFFPLKVGQISV
jgi:hypothetical protein